MPNALAWEALHCRCLPRQRMGSQMQALLP